MSRSVLFDTETTGFDPLTGDRVIEIAAIELHQRPADGKPVPRPAGPGARHPGREHPKVHGITNAHVEGKPKFADIVDAMLEFFGDCAAGRA